MFYNEPLANSPLFFYFSKMRSQYLFRMAFFLFSNLKALVAPGRACVFLAVRAGEWGTCTESSSGFGLPDRCCIVVLLVASAPDQPRAPVEKCPRPIEIALHD